MASRYFDGRTALAHPVALSLRDRALEIRALDGSFCERWPVDAIRSQDDQGEGGEITLSGGHDLTRLVTDETAILELIAAYGSSDHHPARKWRPRTAIICLAAALLLLAGMAWLALDRLPGAIAAALPTRWTNSLGQGLEGMLAGEHKRCTREPGLDTLKEIVGRLAAGAEIAAPVSLTVIDDHSINAVTLPGGRIVLFQGLITRAEDGDEVAAVLAHELGHVARRDPETALIRQLGWSAALGMLGIGGAEEARYGRELLTLSYSREVETEADAAALRFLAAAGMDPSALARFFAVLKQAQGSASTVAWLQTHPPTALRQQRASMAPHGPPAMDHAAWQEVRRVCG